MGEATAPEIPGLFLTPVCLVFTGDPRSLGFEGKTSLGFSEANLGRRSRSRSHFPQPARKLSILQSTVMEHAGIQLLQVLARFCLQEFNRPQIPILFTRNNLCFTAAPRSASLILQEALLVCLFTLGSLWWALCCPTVPRLSAVPLKVFIHKPSAGAHPEPAENLSLCPAPVRCRYHLLLSINRADHFIPFVYCFLI